ncbi:hypothetical protein [Neorhizobium tomejilense]|uniref:hypothetical protein n=1 Tax=Neorhizobium tomejilense TaxID=2093828 RepID=UPI00155F45C2|nr:hypothetical protein [Neorhizobium tomejilense]
MKGSTNSDAVSADGEKTPDTQSGCQSMLTDIATGFKRIGMKSDVHDHSSEVTTSDGQQEKEGH